MTTRVRVAVRCRPLVPKEKEQGCQSCVSVVDDNQVFLNKDKAFTYDYAFGSITAQEEVFQNCGYPLLEAIFKGFNATMLAYGQTGSGKTHTMGSGKLDPNADESTLGIIPRVVEALFRQMDENSDKYKYTTTVSFLEIYNEELKDLLTMNDKSEVLQMREEGTGIKVVGLSEIEVSSPTETLNLLCSGSDNRTTAATEMNAVSSRSHALFTVYVEQTNKTDEEDFWKSKFCLVDLAGSERAKRTGAQGDRFKEGVNINLGLLALGNVISALGDEKQKRSHIPYRDSKLTRLLQDSLGGNSYTVMIACVSPADSNCEETLNTLRYADRAKRIKNKPKVNRDPQMAEILRLRTLVQQLQSGVVNSGVPIMNGVTKSDAVSSLESAKLKEKHELLEKQNQKLSVELANAIDHSNDLCEKVILAEMSRDKLKSVLSKITVETGVSMSELDSSLADPELKPEVRERLNKIREIQCKITEIEKDKSALEVSLSEFNSNLTTIDEESGVTAESQTSTLTPGLSSGESDSAASSPNTKADPEVYTKAYTLHRAQMARQLKELNEMLANKEQLIEKHGDHHKQLEIQREMEKKIRTLEQEREKLLYQVTTNKSAANAGKLSEQRRQKVKELEQQMNEMKMKLKEQNKIIKVNEQTMKQVEKLNREIVQMKQQRVKLMKQIKEEGEKFRKWKLEQDKVVMQLKAKDRKRQCEMAKMEDKHNKAQAFYKRKAEEASVANKRLKDILDKRAAAAKQKSQQSIGCSKTSLNAIRIKQQILEEIDLRVSVKDAERNLDDQLSSRVELTQQLSALKKQLIKALTPEKRQELEERVPYLEAQITTCSAHISEFNQKLADARGSKTQSISEIVSSLPDARIAIKQVLTLAVESRVEALVYQSKDKDTTMALHDHYDKIQSLERELNEMEEYHQNEMEIMKKDFDRKMAAMKKNLEKVGANTSSLSVNSLQLDITEMNGELEEKDRIIAELQKKLETIKDLQNTTFTLTPGKACSTRQLTRTEKDSTLPMADSYFPHLSGKRPSVEPSPLRDRVLTLVRNNTDQPLKVTQSAQQQHGKTKVSAKISNAIPEDDILSLSEDDLSAEDDPADLSWQATPEVRRMRRMSSFTKCSCKTNCASKRCSCSINKRPCGPLCLCKLDICENQYTSLKENANTSRQKNVESMDTSTSTSLNTTQTISKFDLDSSGESSGNKGTGVKRQDNNKSLTTGKRRKLLSIDNRNMLNPPV